MEFFDVSVTGSFNITGSEGLVNMSASYALTASYAENVGAGGGGNAPTFSIVNNLADLTALTASTSDIGFVTASSRYYLYAGDVWKDMSIIPQWGNIYLEDARYDANIITGLSDGDNVSGWYDVSGNHYTLNAITGVGPEYKINIQNGLPVTRWSGISDDSMRIGAKAFANTSSAELTVIAVINTSAGSAATVASIRPVSVATGWTLRFNNSTTLTYFHTGHSPNVTHTTTGSAWNIVSLQRNGLNITIGDLYGSSSDVIAGYNVSTDGSTQVGTESGAGGSYYDGDFGEILIFERYITGSEFDSIISDLRTKWSI